MTETIDYMHRRFRISRAISRLSAVTFFRIVFFLRLSISFYLFLLFFLVFVLLIIDSRARRCRSFDEFFKMQRSGSDEGSTDVISVPSTPRLSASPRHIIFYQSSRTNLPCALHLLITNDKFALRLHWRDRTEANSRRRKCAQGRCILPLPPPLLPSRSPSSKTLKIYQGMFHFTRENLIC